MEIQNQIRFLFIRTKRVVWELECVLQAGCCSLGVAEHWVPKRKGLGIDAERWAGMRESAFLLVVLHCKLLLSRQGVCLCLCFVHGI